MVIRLQPRDAVRPQASGPSPTRRAGERISAGARLAALLRAWPALLVAALLPLATAYAYLRLFPPHYTAVAAVFADGDGGGATNGDSRRSHIQLAASRPVLDRLLVRGDLKDDLAWLGAPGPGARLADIVGRIGGRAERAASQLSARLAAAVTAAPAEANVIQIAVTSGSAASAARLANAAAEVFVDEARNLARPGAGRATAAVSARGEDLKRRLREAEAALAAAGGASPGASPQTAAQLKQRYEEIQRQIGAGAEPGAIAEMLRSPSVDRLKARYDEAVAQEASMRASLGRQHPSTIEARQQVKEKKKLLSEGVRLAHAALRAEAETAQAGPASAGNPPPPAVSTARDDELRRAVEQARLDYDGWLRSGDGSRTSSAARILREATPPSAPNAPEPRLIWLLAGAASVLMATLTSLKASRSAPPAPPTPARRERRGRRDLASTATYNLPAHENGYHENGPAEDSAETETAAHTLTARALAGELSERAWSKALQTLLVTGTDREAIASSALELGGELGRKHLRVLIVDGDEQRCFLSRKLRDAPMAGFVMLDGRKRPLAALETPQGHPLWLAPALASLADEAGRDMPLVVPALAGHFDVVLIAAAELGEQAGEVALAAASDLVIAADDGAGRSVPALARAVTHALHTPAENIRLLRRSALQARSGNVLKLDLK